MANADSDAPEPGRPFSAAALSGSLQVDESEVAQLIGFLREAPGRISVVMVPGPVVTAEVLRRIHAAGLEVDTLELIAPLPLADKLETWRERHVVATIASLDTASAFASTEDGAAFWRALNMQRERLAPGNVRLCLFVEPTQHAAFVAHAGDLRSWTREFSFLDTMLPIPAESRIVSERRDAPEMSSLWRVETLREQLARAREAGLAESVIVRDYALPLFQGLVESGCLRDAEVLWYRELRQGAAAVDPEMRVALATLHATLLEARGDTEQALREYEHVRTLLWKRVSAESGAGRTSRELLAVIHSRIGHIFSRLGRSDDARKHHEHALTILERLARSDPDNVTLQRNMSIAYEKLGDASWQRGDIETARRLYEKDLSVVERLVQRSPEDQDFQRDLSIVHERLGDIQRGLGRTNDARQFYEKALVSRERLADKHPGATILQAELATACERLADALVGSGQERAALQLYRRSLSIRERLASQAPDRADLKADLAVPLMRLGFEDATLLRRALSILKALDAEGRLPADRRGWIATIEEMLKRGGQ